MLLRSSMHFSVKFVRETSMKIVSKCAVQWLHNLAIWIQKLLLHSDHPFFLQLLMSTYHPCALLQEGGLSNSEQNRECVTDVARTRVTVLCKVCTFVRQSSLE